MVVDACAALAKNLVLNENKAGEIQKANASIMHGWLGTVNKTVNLTNGKGKGKETDRVLVVVG